MAFPLDAKSVKVKNDADAFFGKNRNEFVDYFVKSISEFDVPSMKGLQRLNTNWNSEIERSRYRLHNAKTSEDVYYSLLSLVRSFHDGHSKLETDNSLRPSNRSVELPVTFNIGIHDHQRIYIVEKSQDSQITQGMVFKEMDGLTATQWEDSFREWHSNTSPEALWLNTATWLTQRKSTKMPVPSVGTSATIKVWDPVRKIEIERILKWNLSGSSIVEQPLRCGSGNDLDYKDRQPVFIGLNYCVYDTKDTTLIRYFSFIYDFSQDELWNKTVDLSYRPAKLSQDAEENPYAIQDILQLKNSLTKSHRSKIVIDVRNNSGGGLYPSLFGVFAKKDFTILKRRMYFSSYMRKHKDFFDEAISMGTPAMNALIENEMKQNPKAEKSRFFPFFCKTKDCSESEARFSPSDSSNISKNIYVLTGPTCVSSCDQFVAIMKDNEIAKIVGLPSMGAHSPFRAPLPLKMKNNSPFKVTFTLGEGIRPNGVSLEGNPASPDIRIEFQESYLDQALTMISEELTTQH